MSSINETPSRCNVPDAMKPYPQFVLWRLIQKPGKPKPDKVPYNPGTGGPASVTDPSTWGTYEGACEAFKRGGYNGIGFVFTASDPFVFIDQDDCLSTDNTWKPHCQDAMARFPGAWEVSQSGKGLHGFGCVIDKSSLRDKRRKWADTQGNKWEFYAQGRFVAFGGGGFSGGISVPWDNAIAQTVPDAEQSSDVPLIEWLDRARPGYSGPENDEELIASILANRPPAAVMGKKPFPAALFNADVVQLGHFYPDCGGQERAFDHSSAELALANLLAWWTGCNPARMERLFNRSALSRSDPRKTRLAISKAIADPNRSYFSRKQRQEENERIGDNLEGEALPHIMTLKDATDNLVFIGNGSSVVDRNSKRVRTYNDAVHEYAASKHPHDTGKVDGDGRPIIKHIPVMKLWLQSDDRKSVDTVTWAPGAPEFCHAVERTQSGDRAYNLYVTQKYLTPPSNWVQWVEPFLQHVAYLVPIEAERKRFLCWIAHIFQHPGELPHTAYLMVATQTGIGRGTLASILTRALRGYVAANMNIEALFGGFNGRISQKLLATVDEVREGHSHNRYANAEALKSKITEETRSLNPKYGVQSVEKNCCRWLMFSNHLDALPIDNADRRIIVIENPTGRLNPEWYSYLHGVMNDPAFIASIQQLFLTYDLTGFNAHEPAPINDAKRKALSSLETDTTRAIRDFVKLWPDDLATLADLRAYIGEETPSNRAMQHEVDRAGMRTAKKFKIMGKLETVLIVRGILTRDDIDATPSAAVVPKIVAARERFRITGG